MTNQSSILHTVDTNKITVNGVNVIVDKPKVGDVMCVTKYKNNSGTLLDTDKQKVIWIDGLSINPDQLSEKLEPVGICMVVNGNKALVKYREEKVLDFLNMHGNFMELPESSYMNNGKEHNFIININDSNHSCLFTVNDTSSRYHFVRRLNDFFHSYYPNYSAELVELDSEIPVSSYHDADKKDSKGDYYNRIIITSLTTTSYFAIDNPNVGSNGSIQAVHTEIQGVKSNTLMYRKNGFDSLDSYTYSIYSGCNFARYYDYCYTYGSHEQPTSINTGPLAYTYFTNYKNSYNFLQKFANYEDYVDSFMIKYPCGKGIVADDPSGKESTYKLGNSNYFNNISNNTYVLYPAAYYATNISVNAPNLGKGNWWIPSVSELAQMMRDIETKKNIVNTVLSKFSGLSYFDNYISTSYNKFTSSFCQNTDYDYRKKPTLQAYTIIVVVVLV